MEGGVVSFTNQGSFLGTLSWTTTAETRYSVCSRWRSAIAYATACPAASHAA
jgi:hypothetical protein